MKTKKPFGSRSSALLCALLFATGAGMAGAQTTTTDVDPSNPATPDDMSADAEATAEDAMEPEEMAEPVQGQITMQGDGTVLASTLMGATVYSSASSDESIGDIGDLIVNLDGTVEGVVVGVGGFIGIGEKSVAVEMAQLSISMNEEDEPRLVLDATKEDLEAAPAFVTMQDQKDAAAAAAAQEEMETTMPAADESAIEPMDTPATTDESTTTQ